MDNQISFSLKDLKDSEPIQLPLVVELDTLEYRVDSLESEIKRFAQILIDTIAQNTMLQNNQIELQKRIEELEENEQSRVSSFD